MNLKRDPGKLVPRSMDLSRGAQGGYTLAEAMVAVAILAVICAFGIPEMSYIVRKTRVAEVVNQLNLSVQVGRSEARKRNRSVVLCAIVPDTTPPICKSTSETEWSDGWMMFVDPDGDGAPNSPDELIGITTRQEGNVAVQAAGSTVQIKSDGTLRDVTTKTLPTWEVTSIDGSGVPHPMIASKRLSISFVGKVFVQ